CVNNAAAYVTAIAGTMCWAVPSGFTDFARRSRKREWSRRDHSRSSESNATDATSPTGAIHLLTDVRAGADGVTESFCALPVLEIRRSWPTTRISLVRMAQS